MGRDMSRSTVRAPSTRHCIFISYRRDESQHVAGRLYDRLLMHFDRKDVFKDVDSIPYGSDFREHLRSAISNCKVMLVLVGDRWAAITGKDGTPRLEEPRDFVRLEIEYALNLGVQVIPILIENSKLPSATVLPESIRALSFRQATRLRADPDFDGDASRLISAIKEIIAPQQLVKPTKLTLGHLSGGLVRLLVPGIITLVIAIGIAFSWIGVPHLFTPDERPVRDSNPHKQSTYGSEPQTAASAPEPVVGQTPEDLLKQTDNPIPPIPVGAPLVMDGDFGQVAVPWPIDGAQDANAPFLQISFASPEGVHIGWAIRGGFAENQLVTPASFNFRSGNTYRLKMSNFEEHDGLTIYPRLKLCHVAEEIRDYMADSKLTVEVTAADLADIEKRKTVVKVYYLPNATMPPDEDSKGVSGAPNAPLDVIQSLSTSSNQSPLTIQKNAAAKGIVIAVFTLGNIDLEVPAGDNSAARPEA